MSQIEFGLSRSIGAPRRTIEESKAGLLEDTQPAFEVQLVIEAFQETVLARARIDLPTIATELARCSYSPQEGDCFNHRSAAERSIFSPWQWRDVLTQGAFLPYREFTSTRRLTNEEWRKQLDQGGPSATACTSPIEVPPRSKP